MPLGGIIGGLLGGGGGGGSTSYAVTSTVQGGATPVGLVSTVQGGGAPVSLVSTVQGGAKAVELDVGLDDVNVDVGGTGTPLHSIGELRLPQPLRSSSDVDLDSHVDVEPVQVDVCLDVGLSRLPRARIDQPWKGRFGVRVLGVELVGYEWAGAGSTIMDGLDETPHVELGDTGRHGGGGRHGGHGHHARAARTGAGGIRIDTE